MKNKNTNEFVELEKGYYGLKRNLLNLVGLDIDTQGFIFDDESGDRLLYKNKFINARIESDQYKDVIPFSVMNNQIFFIIFNMFSNMIDEEDGIYIKSINEEYTKLDQNGISKSRLVVLFNNGFKYFTDYYYISGLKFYEMIARIADVNSKYDLSNLDSYEFVMAFNERSKKMSDANARRKKKVVKTNYDFEQ